MSAVDSIKYGTRKNECFLIYDNEFGFMERTISNVGKLKDKWQDIEDFEISKRINGKVLSKMILTFPREWTQSQNENAIRRFLENQFGNCNHYTFCFHEGKSGDNYNPHGHLYYSERMLNDVKLRKNPQMSKMGYIKKMSKSWFEFCGLDLSKIPKVPRIPMKEWKADPEKAKSKKYNMKKDWMEEMENQKKVQKQIAHVDQLTKRIRHSVKRKPINRTKKNENAKEIFAPNLNPAFLNDRQLELQRIVRDDYEQALNAKQFIKFLEHDGVIMTLEQDKLFFGFEDENTYSAELLLKDEEILQLEEWISMGQQFRLKK